MTFWTTLTRLGESQLLLPALLLSIAWTALGGRSPGLAWRWLLAVGTATLVVTVSKVAFIGFGIGSARWDFTGVSGHAMFAAAVWPLLASDAVAGRPRWWPAAWACAALLALLIAVSRVVIQVHSVSEVVAGFLVGSAASAWALWRTPARRAGLPVLLVAAWGLWLALATPYAPPSPTHGWVTQLSLAVSGRRAPYTRAQMHLEARRGAQLDRLGVPVVLQDL